MPRSGAGTYTLPAPYPSGFQNGTTIDAPTMNTVLTDVQNAMTASLAADGQTPVTGDFNWGGNDITNVALFSAASVVTATAATSGGLTVGNTLVVTKGGATVTAGGLTVSAGGADITGNTKITGTLSGLTGMTIASGGAAITGATFFVGAMDVTGSVTASTSFIIGSSGPSWTVGTGAPATTTPKGSLYSRTDGGVGTTLYVSQGGGTWNPVAGV